MMIVISKHRKTNYVHSTKTKSKRKVMLPLIFLNLHNLGTERDTTKEHQMNSMDMLYLST